MCLGGTPKMPAVQEPTRPQEAKSPAPGAFGSTAAARKKMQGPAGAAGTLLTGPSGVENSQLSLGKSTLLGM
jgi:hypothetical protein